MGAIYGGASSSFTNLRDAAAAQLPRRVARHSRAKSAAKARPRRVVATKATAAGAGAGGGGGAADSKYDLRKFDSYSMGICLLMLVGAEFYKKTQGGSTQLDPPLQADADVLMLDETGAGLMVDGLPNPSQLDVPLPPNFNGTFWRQFRQEQVLRLLGIAGQPAHPLRDLINRCLARNSVHALSVHDMRRHPWVREHEHDAAHKAVCRDKLTRIAAALRLPTLFDASTNSLEEDDALPTAVPVGMLADSLKDIDL